MMFRIEILIEARIRNGWSQTDLAKAIGISPSTISQIEGGKIKGLPSTIKRIAEALELSMEDLMIVEQKGSPL